MQTDRTKYNMPVTDWPKTTKICVEYIWIDHTGLDIRGKTRVIGREVKSVTDIPEWNYDGSSTGQAPTENSEVILKPVRFYPDPFRKGNNIIALCETFVWADGNHSELKPADTNFRHFASKIDEELKDEDIWCGLE